MGEDGSTAGCARLNADVTAPAAARAAARDLGRWLARAAPRQARGDVAIALVSDAKMRRLNRNHRGIDRPTDVLSFPNQPDEFESDRVNLGDIVISVEQAKRQAEENGLTLDCEIKQLILHGLLHLCGYDHETDNGEMNARELELREHLKI